jgi:hypothetical protein
MECRSPPEDPLRAVKEEGWWGPRWGPSYARGFVKILWLHAAASDSFDVVGSRLRSASDGGSVRGRACWLRARTFSARLGRPRAEPETELRPVWCYVLFTLC